MKKYNLEDLNNPDPKIKYSAQKQLIQLSESDPGSLYSDFDYFVKLLSSKNNILKWTGILVLGNLSKVDKENKLDKVLPLLISKLNEGKMITANNTVKALTVVSRNIPVRADKLALEMLKVRGYKYDTLECSFITQGQVLTSLKQIWDILSEDVRKKAVSFANANLNCPRNATSKKAQAIIKA